MKTKQEDAEHHGDDGIRALVDGLTYGGAAYLAHGWNPRPVEGFDHIFFYALEHHTGKKFIHGYPVLLGVYLGSRLHDCLDEHFVLRVVKALDIDIRPSAMGITWDDVFCTLKGLPEWAERTEQMFTIANICRPTQEWLESAKEELETTFA